MPDEPIIIPDEAIKSELDVIDLDKEERIYIPYNATEVSLDKLGITSDDYERIIIDTINKKESYETKKKESESELTTKKIEVSIISKYSIEKDFDDVLTELNIDGKSPEAEVLKKTWSKVSAVVKDRDAQQKTVNDLTETLGKIKNPNGDNYKETEKSLVEAKKKLVDKIETVKEVKQRPSDEEGRLIEDIAAATSTLDIIQTELESATEQSTKIETAKINNMEANMHYNNIFQPHNDFLASVKESLEKDENGLFDAATARIKSAQYIYGKKLKARIEKACDEGQYGFVADDLTTVECYLLNSLGYEVEEIDGGNDIVKVIRKKYTTNYITKPDDTPDFHVTWNKVLNGQGDMK